MTLPPLVPANDADHALFKQRDERWFLRAAMAAIRSYCGWHISPIVREVDVRRPVDGGLILLKSMHVTDVEKVEVDGRLLVKGHEYDWDEAGFISRTCTSWPRSNRATVTFTHGYTVAPDEIKSVVFELATTAQALPAGVADRIGSGPFQISLRALGVTMTKEQQNRIAGFKLFSGAVG